MKKHYIFCQHHRSENTLREYLKKQFNAEALGDGRFICETGKDYQFVSFVGNIWAQMGETGLLFVIDLDDPTREIVFSHPRDLASEWRSNRDSHQKHLQESLSPILSA